MKTIFLSLSVAVAIAFGATSCNKTEENNVPTPKNTAPATSIPDDAGFFFKSSLFYVSSTNAYGQSSEYKVGDGFGFFKNSSGQKVNAGDVTLNTWPLEKDGEGNYKFKNLGNVPEGVSFTNNWAVWQATGDTATGIPVVNVTDGTPFPAKPTIQDKKINTQENFILMAGDTIIADSTVFVLSGPNASIRKVKGPNAKSCVFSKEEMQTLGTGRSLGLIQISPFTTVLDTAAVPGFKTYFQKQVVYSKYVDLE
ncbi:MAG TPA: hypothetical protein PL084_01935 [Chitinophagales bacterium]|nr:MAG: hypothetical protein BGO32_10835 [Bacteroidetes bacterium 37-13]HRN93460.1 hypothetical protein [Chitinophagales bacterium]HRP38488.1 hypothetical protein [Chitinophagales bacterium]